jgi:hypothetical protein
VSSVVSGRLEEIGLEEIEPGIVEDSFSRSLLRR